MIVTMSRIRAGEDHLTANGLAHVVPEFHRVMVRSMWRQRIQGLLALTLAVLTVLVICR